MFADQRHFNADPDPAFRFDADTDPAFHLNPDPDLLIIMISATTGVQTLSQKSAVLFRLLF